MYDTHRRVYRLGCSGRVNRQVSHACPNGAPVQMRMVTRGGSGKLPWDFCAGIELGGSGDRPRLLLAGEMMTCNLLGRTLHSFLPHSHGHTRSLKAINVLRNWERAAMATVIVVDRGAVGVTPTLQSRASSSKPLGTTECSTKCRTGPAAGHRRRTYRSACTGTYSARR